MYDFSTLCYDLGSRRGTIRRKTKSAVIEPNISRSVLPESGTEEVAAVRRNAGKTRP
jgi:hypothetical protein